jgi:hypothetical protein
MSCPTVRQRLVLTFLTSLALWGLYPAIAQNALTLQRNFRPDPIRLSGTAGGTVSLAAMAGVDANCRGFANTTPNHTLTLAETFPTLDLLVLTDNINHDPTLLLKGDNGIVICADNESRGRLPQIAQRLPRGSYQMWVGTKEPGQTITYQLSLSEIRQR